MDGTLNADTLQPSVLKPGGHGWQLILADLALILFLMTLTALPDEEAAAPRAAPRVEVRAEVAASQALYRPVPGGPGIGEWLAAQPRDPRATLTVFALHAPGGEAAAWHAAQALARKAEGHGVAVRTIISAGAESDLYASLAYDEARGGE